MTRGVYPRQPLAERFWSRVQEGEGCLRHFAIDTPPLFCEQCGKPWKAVMDGREGRKRRRERAS